MLNRTVSVPTPGYPEIVGEDRDGNAIVQFVFDLQIHAARATTLPRGTRWRLWPPGPAGYATSLDVRAITELGFEWFITKPGSFGIAPGLDYPDDRGAPGRIYWNHNTQAFINPGGWWNQIRDATAPTPEWETTAQPFTVSTSTGDGTARLVVPAEMLPPGRHVDIVVRSRFAVDKPRRNNDKIGFSEMVVVGRINENVGPTLSLSSPLETNLTSPISISGTVADLDLHGSGTSGIAAVDFSITDIGRNPRRTFDFDTFRWTEGDAAHKTIESLTPISAGGSAHRFEEQWRNPGNGASGEFELEVRALDGSGNVGTVTHRFVVDDEDPIVRFESPTGGQVVTGDIAWVDGTVEDDSAISSVRLSVYSMLRREFLQPGSPTPTWASSEVLFEPIIEVVGGVTTFRWGWPIPAEPDLFLVQAIAQDAAGRQTRSRLRFGSAPIDDEPPHASVTSPRPNTVHSGSVRVRGRARDNVELVDMRVELWSHIDAHSGPMTRVFDQSVPIAGQTQWKYFSIDVDVAPLIAIGGAGVYSIAVVGIDAAGHETRDLREVTLQA